MYCAIHAQVVEACSAYVLHVRLIGQFLVQGHTQITHFAWWPCRKIQQLGNYCGRVKSVLERCPLVPTQKNLVSKDSAEDGLSIQLYMYNFVHPWAPTKCFYA